MQARAAAKEGAREGAVPDVITYTTLIKGCCVAGDVAAGLTLLADMRDLSVLPNVVCRAFLILLDSDVKRDLPYETQCIPQLADDLPVKHVCLPACVSELVSLSVVTHGSAFGHGTLCK